MSLGVSLPYISLIEPYIPRALSCTCTLHLTSLLLSHISLSCCTCTTPTKSEISPPERGRDVVRSEIMWSRQKVYRSPGGGTHWGSEGQNQDRSGLRVCEVASIADLLVGQRVPRWGLQPFNAKPRLLVALHCIAEGGGGSGENQ